MGVVMYLIIYLYNQNKFPATEVCGQPKRWVCLALAHLPDYLPKQGQQINCQNVPAYNQILESELCCFQLLFFFQGGQIKFTDFAIENKAAQYLHTKNNKQG